jgi:hypothetical protein
MGVSGRRCFESTVIVAWYILVHRRAKPRVDRGMELIGIDASQTFGRVESGAPEGSALSFTGGESEERVLNFCRVYFKDLHPKVSLSNFQNA